MSIPTHTLPLLLSLCAGEGVVTRNVNAGEARLLQFVWQAGALLEAEDLQ
jgi:hypothetical protein